MLTIRVAKERPARAAGASAREILTNLGANVYGVVVNGIDGGANQGYGKRIAIRLQLPLRLRLQLTRRPDNSSYYRDDEDDDALKNGTHDAAAKNGDTKNSQGDEKKSKKLPKMAEMHRAAGPEKAGGVMRWLRETLWH